MDERDGLSEPLLKELNSLGFALTDAGPDAEPSFTLTRFALGNHLFLTIEPAGPGRWLVGFETRPNSAFPVLRGPTLPFAIGQFGDSPDGVHLALSRDQLESALPRLLKSAILPAVDAALREE